MSHEYSDPRREEEPYALPEVEVFHIPDDYAPEQDQGDEPFPEGWYWWPCFPGCLPDGEPVGPFTTEAEALADAQGDDACRCHDCALCPALGDCDRYED